MRASSHAPPRETLRGRTTTAHPSIAAHVALATVLCVAIIASCKRSNRHATESVTDPWQPESGMLSPALPTYAYASAAGNTQIASFGRAKENVASFHRDHRRTFLCNCPFDEAGQIDAAACGYVPLTPGKQSEQVVWELVVPYTVFGESFDEWSEGHEECVDRKGNPFRGRDCARMVSAAFRLMEADMYNLQPFIGEIVDHRNRAPFSMIPGETHAFGACDIEIARRVVRPRAAVRGDIARTYMYMDQAYPGRGIITSLNRVQFEVWAKHDPVDRWECERARRIAAVQGNANRVVEKACREANL